jgi:hypothetical protein
MRKNHFVLVLLMVLCFVGCKDDETFGEDSAECDQAWAELTSETFSGIIYYCDYQHYRGTATVVRGSGDLISIHLVADSFALDTTVFYTAKCHLAEKTIPLILIKHTAITEEGQYNQNPDRIGIMMPYRNCVGDNSLYFEGYVE